MENNNNIVSDIQPPFETSSGGSLDKETLTSYQKKIYNDALLYATKNNDPQAKDFALQTALSTSISHGKNNPFGDLASKNEPGTIKNGIKYRDYPTTGIPLSKQYDKYIQEQNNNIIAEQNQQQAINDLAQAQQQVPDQNIPVEQPQQIIPQDVAPNSPNSTQLNFNLEPGAVYNRNFSDQQVQNSNPSEQINVTNPIQQFGCGGSMGKSYEAGGNLNSYDTGGTHESSPLGGIPQGIGSNGKQNTVEEGETSHKINGKKFIFSNRIFL